MACRLFGTKPLPEPFWLIVNWTPGNKFQWKSNQNSFIFIQENAFEIVVCQSGCHIARGLRGWWVNALCVAKPSIDMILTTQCNRFLVYRGKGLQQSEPSQYWKTTSNAYIYSYFYIFFKALSTIRVNTHMEFASLDNASFFNWYKNGAFVLQNIHSRLIMNLLVKATLSLLWLKGHNLPWNKISDVPDIISALIQVLRPPITNSIFWDNFNFRHSLPVRTYALYHIIIATYKL